MEVYVEYYNKIRPHQAEGARQGRIGQQIPKGYEIKDGEIRSQSILFGLNQEYYREVA